MNGLAWFRPRDRHYTVGRSDSIVEPGYQNNVNRYQPPGSFKQPDSWKLNGGWLDDNVPGWHTTGWFHDNWVDFGTKTLGLPDWAVNEWTIPFAYGAAVLYETANSALKMFGIDWLEHSDPHTPSQGSAINESSSNKTSGGSCL